MTSTVSSISAVGVNDSAVCPYKLNSGTPVASSRAPVTAKSSRTDGKVKWKTLTGDDIRAGAALGSDGTIYVGSYDRSLYAIAPSGQVRWKLAAADKIHSTPAITTDGKILFGAQDTHVYAVDPDGTLRWYWQSGGDVDTTPVVSRDGTVYVAGDDQKLHALK